MGFIAEINKRREERELSRRLGFKAAKTHEQALELAVQHISQSIAEGDRDARKILKTHIRNVPNNAGLLDIVSLAERAESGELIHHLEIAVATKPDEFKANDDAIASDVSWTTKMGTIVTEDDGTQIFVVLGSFRSSVTVEGKEIVQ